MKKILHFVVLFLTISTFSAKAQIIITSTGTPYSQDFNTLGNTGSTNTILPTGWAILETGSGTPNNVYTADAGTTVAGNTYSYGAVGSTERALGSLSSGSIQSKYGASFSNTSGSTITSLTITYVGEQWRLGVTNGTRLDSLNFRYSTDATSLSTGTWIDENTLDFTSPKSNATLGALDGNLAGNKTTITSTISGLNIPNNTTFWIRWDDVDVAGADDGIAIDDVSISFNGIATAPCSEPAAQPTVLNLTPSPTSIAGSFTASSPVADQYLVVRSTSPTLSASPVDATTYTTGQAFGGGIIVSVGSGTNFDDAGLTSSTHYYYYVFAFNSDDCINGPNYLSTTPLINNTTSSALAACIAPAASPTVLNLTPSNTTILGSFTASASANRYLIVRSLTATLSANPVNGTAYTTGQALGGGVVVDYTTNNSFVATGLTVGTKYYFYVFAANAECTGEPFYRTTALIANATTTNSSTGIPAGYYANAQGKTCADLKTALKTIISANTVQLTYTPGVWNAVKTTDVHRNDANTADIIWDIYTDNPTGPELYTFTPGTDQCGTYSAEGDCYNREHSFPQEWFGSGHYPMYSDIHHIFPVDGWVNAKHDHNPYGEVANPVFISKSNKSKSGPNTFGCYNGTVFEPIDAYKGDIARAQLYMITRYEDSMVLWQNNGDANTILNGTKYPSLDDWYIQLLLKWHHQDPVSQKEIDRNNAIYAIQKNRNPYIDNPDFADQLFTCVTLQCVVPVKLISFGAVKNATGISLNWSANTEVKFKSYDVERSIDGVNFYKVGTVSGQNIANYYFNDNVLPNTNIILYYRLKMNDIDGGYNYSKVATVRLESPTVKTLMYPNPATNNVTLKLLQNLKANSILKITDLIGRTVMQKNISATQNIIPLNIEHLSAGKYFITIKNDVELIHQSFVKIK